MLKVHPSNFVVRGFTRAVEVGELAAVLAGTGVPLVADVGSGLLRPHPLLPDEPDLQTTLAAGADLVLASGDKLLGGPQAGLVLGRAELVQRLRRHPLYRALRVDKTTLAALEATLRGPLPPVQEMLAADVDGLRERAARARRPARRRRHRRGGRRRGRPRRRGRGAGAPAARAPRSRCRRPSPRPCGWADRPVVGYVEDDRTLLNLRSLPPAADDALAAAVLEVPARTGGRDRHRRPRRPRQVRAGPRADRHGARPLGRGAPPRAHHRPRVRLDDAALGPAVARRRRARPRAVRRQHAGRRRLGARGAARRRGRRRLVGADRPSTSPSSTPSACGTRCSRSPRPTSPTRRPVLADVARAARGDVDGRRARRSRSAPSPVRGCRSWPPPWRRCWPACPPPTPPRRSGCGSTGPSPSRAPARSSRARWRPAPSRTGDRLLLGDREVVVRGVQSLGEPVERAAATARVALNLRGLGGRGAVPRRRPAHPGAFRRTVGARRRAGRRTRGTGCPAEAVVHVGSATVGARLRPAGRRGRPAAAGVAAAAAGRRPAAAARPGRAAGARCRRPGRRPARAAPPRGRPAAGRRPGRAAGRRAGAAAELARRRIVRADDFAAMGWPVPEGATVHGPWLLGAGSGRRAGRAACPASWPRTGGASAGARPAGGGGAPGARAARRRAARPRSSARRSTLRDGRVVDGAADLPPEVQRAVDAIRDAAGRRSVRRARKPVTWPPRGWACGNWPPPCAAVSWCGSPTASTWRRASPSAARARLADGCRSRSRSARRARRGGPAGGSPSRSWSGWTRQGVTVAAARQHPPAALTLSGRGR